MGRVRPANPGAKGEGVRISGTVHEVVGSALGGAVHGLQSAVLAVDPSGGQRGARANARREAIRLTSEVRGRNEIPPLREPVGMARSGEGR